MYIGLYTISNISDSISIIKSIPVSVSKRQINDTFNKIDVFVNYISLKIVHPEQYIPKGNLGKKVNILHLHFILKMKRSLLHYKIC